MATTQNTTQPGLINTAPGMTDTLPGVSPPGGSSGSPVTGYDPASSAPGIAVSQPYTPNAFSVPEKATVVSQLHDIIDSGSPLMQQAETRAKNTMNGRGLINSSMAIGAGQDAVIGAATPIATADASTYARASENTTAAQNTAAAANAGAENTTRLQNAQLETSTGQFNAGQKNAALAAASGASNQIQLQAQQNAANLENIKTNRAVDLQITQLTEKNKDILQSSQMAGALYNQSLQNLSAIITNPNLSQDQKSAALNDGVQQLNDALSIISQITNTPSVQSLLTFGPPGPAAAPAADTSDTTQDTGLINSQPESTGSQAPPIAPAPVINPNPLGRRYPRVAAAV